MFKILVFKEIRSILQSPKFLASFVTLSILIILSIFIGIKEYQINVEQYFAGKNMTEQELSEKTSWMGSHTIVYRVPDPMQIFISGINNDVGRLSNISPYSDVNLLHSYYSDDPVFAVFRFLDLAFIVQIVFSLIAILFTYNAINGEREMGTLKLVMSNSVFRSKYLLAKWFGCWSGLISIVIIPILLGLLFLFIYQIPLSITHWLKLLSFLIISLIYFTFFITLGLLVSAASRESSTSFLILLVCWLCFVLIIPRLGTMAAAQIVNVPGSAQIESQKSAFEKKVWKNFENEMVEVWRQRNDLTTGMTAEERQQFQDDNMWNWMQEDDAARKQIEKEIAENSKILNEELRNQKIQQEKLGFLFSRLSPASSFQLAVMNIAETDIGLKHRYESAMELYKNQFVSFLDKKQQESGDVGGLQITIDSDRGIAIQTPDLKKTIDLSEMPTFLKPVQSFANIINGSILDFILLVVYSATAFIFSLLFFIRYDVR